MPAAGSVVHGFRPGLWPTLAAIAVVTVTILLGNWQLRRADFRAGLQAQAARASAESMLELSSASNIKAEHRYRRVTGAGVFVADRQIWLDNRTHKGASGYYVLTPLRFDDGSHVLVNRGWIAATKLRDAVPPAQPPAGPIHISGRLNAPPAGFLALSNTNVAGPVWQNLDLAEYARVTGIEVAPLIVEQTNVPADGLVREWPMPDFRRNTNVSYMWQWYSFAALTAVLWVVLGFRAGRSAAQADDAESRAAGGSQTTREDK